MSEEVPQIVCLLTDQQGRLKRIAFSSSHSVVLDPGEEGYEIAEWPVKPLRSLAGGLYEYATEHIATDTADLGKLTSIDTLLEIAFAIRGREGWKCINVLPGLFGERCFPPGVTVVWQREVGDYMVWCEASVKEPREIFRATFDDIGPDQAGETA